MLTIVDDPDLYDGAHVAVQVVGRRFQEEKVLAITELLGDALESMLSEGKPQSFAFLLLSGRKYDIGFRRGGFSQVMHPIQSFILRNAHYAKFPPFVSFR